ncbi:TIGR02302 family protein [Planktotalea arctica]|uniref:TIGR02302 family protein n=1 Tax=Planktotalea arctica TaxID=1481893 RepID=UPI00321B4C12
MASDRPRHSKTLARLRVPLALTWLGISAERAARALWPLWSLIIAVLGTLMLGLHDAFAIEAVWALAVISCSAGVYFLLRGFQKFRLPSRLDALARLDASLPGRPIQALMDSQAIGPQDAASAAVWHAHQERMASRASLARAVKPQVRLAAGDPFALRYVAALLLGVALLFGSLWRVATVTDIAQGNTGLAGGPVWEGWVEPPAYTGKPSLYLSDQEGRFEVPEGSRISLRLYGEIGALTVAETLSGRVEETGSAADPEQNFIASKSGTLEVAGPNGRIWQIAVTPDSAPRVEVTGAPERSAEGLMSLPFEASDDYDVIGGRAQITLDLAAVTRRYGLSVDPEPQDAIELDLPLPISGDRSDFAETLFGDFSRHPFANLPVSLSMTVEDAKGQSSAPNITHMILPGRRFFDPLASALIEQRQWLLWSVENGVRTAQMLRAISHLPDDIFREETVYLRLRVILRRIETQIGFGSFSGEARDEAAEALWDLALLVEDGDVQDALERMRRAQERLSEAMKNGASDDEIAELMDELRRANENYIQQLQRETARNGENSERPPGAQDDAMQMTQDDLQAMMDRIQELMEEGRMAEAEQALQELQDMMENMQIAEGQQGQGEPSEGQQAMEGLADTLRDQQGLSDQAFRDLQEQFNPNAQAGENQGNEGRNGGQGRGQSHDNRSGEGQGQGEGQSEQGQEGQQAENGGAGLAQRQEDLRAELERQRGSLPGAGSEAGDAARDALRRAEEAMRGAGDALRRDDLAEAIDRQAEAMDALRDGMRNLGEALAETEQNQGQQGTAEGRQGGEQRDPLGRSPGANGQAGTDEGLLQGEDVYRRARELLDEIRKRSGENARPEGERDYLRRLLDRF